MNLTTRVRLRLEREIYRLRFHGQVVPLDPLLRRADDPKLPSPAVPAWRTISNGRRLSNSYLAETLAQEELGTWALDAQVLNFLELEIAKRKPAAILEFGAGLSTICLAHYQNKIWGASPTPRVFSIEQNEWQVEKSWQQLGKLGLADNVRILHAPVVPQVIEGRETPCYRLPADILSGFLGDIRPEFVLVDGPAGDGDTRFGTLPLVKDYLGPDTVVYLDDALRPEELLVAKLWRDLPYLSLSGVRLFGKGLLAGHFTLQGD